MYNRVYNFFTTNNFIYLLELDNSILLFYVLIILIEDIVKNVSKGITGCGIFVDLRKFEHHGTYGMVLQMNVLNSTSFTEKKLVSINGHVPNETSVKSGV